MALLYNNIAVVIYHLGFALPVKLNRAHAVSVILSSVVFYFLFYSIKKMKSRFTTIDILAALAEINER